MQTSKGTRKEYEKGYSDMNKSLFSIFNKRNSNSKQKQLSTGRRGMPARNMTKDNNKYITSTKDPRYIIYKEAMDAYNQDRKDARYMPNNLAELANRNARRAANREKMKKWSALQRQNIRIADSLLIR